MNTPPSNYGKPAQMAIPEITFTISPAEESKPTHSPKSELSSQQTSAPVKQASSEQKRLVAIARYASSIGTEKLSTPLLDAAELPGISEAAIKWASHMQKTALEKGTPLTPDQIKIAEKMGVRNPEKVRLVIGEIPQPTDEKLLLVIGKTIGLHKDINGQAYGYGVFITENHKDNVTVLSHELRHVKQSEDFGSVEHFTKTYVEQLNVYGYGRSGLEQDAYKKQLGSIPVGKEAG